MKRRSLSRIFAVALMALVTACTMAPPYSDLLQGWVGRDVDELVGKWGAPDRQFERADGSRVIGYDVSWEMVRHIPGPAYYGAPPYFRPYSGYYGSMGPTYYVTETCRTNFVITKERRVESWSYDGACISSNGRWSPDKPAK